MLRILRAIMQTLLLLHLAAAYATTNQRDHFKHISSAPFVLTVMINTSRNANALELISKTEEQIKNHTTIQNRKVVVEIIDTAKTPFFDKHYKLDGKHSLRFFIKGQMIELHDFDATIEDLKDAAITKTDLVSKLVGFVDEKINRISIELKNVEQLKSLLEADNVVGFFYGDDKQVFEKYHKVAMKNIDFIFTHTNDKSLADTVFYKYANKTAPGTPTFAIIRSASALNDLDTAALVEFTNFGEKALTEFIEFERFAKLRDASAGSDIVKRIFHKFQPLLLYVGSEKTNPKNFAVFKQAVKSLPKKMVFANVEPDSPQSASFMQLFVMAGKNMAKEALNIVWLGPNRKIQVENYTVGLDKEAIVEFVAKFNRQYETVIDAMRQHFYDKEEKEIGNGVTSQEL